MCLFEIESKAPCHPPGDSVDRRLAIDVSPNEGCGRIEPVGKGAAGVIDQPLAFQLPLFEVGPPNRSLAGNENDVVWLAARRTKNQGTRATRAFNAAARSLI